MVGCWQTNYPKLPPPTPPAIKRQWLRFQYRTRLVVESSAFNNLFLMAILGNAALLAVEYDGMRPGCVVGVGGGGVDGGQ